MPVPFDSETQQKEAARDFEEATQQIMEASKKQKEEVLRRSMIDNSVMATLETVALKLINSTIEQCSDESTMAATEVVPRENNVVATSAPRVASTQPNTLSDVEPDDDDDPPQQNSAAVVPDLTVKDKVIEITPLKVS